MQPLLTAYFNCKIGHKHFTFIVILEYQNKLYHGDKHGPVNSVISFFMCKVILTIITKPS